MWVINCLTRYQQWLRIAPHCTDCTAHVAGGEGAEPVPSSSNYRAKPQSTPIPPCTTGTEIEPPLAQGAWWTTECDLVRGHSLLVALMTNRPRICKDLLFAATLRIVRDVIHPLWFCHCAGHCKCASEAARAS